MYPNLRYALYDLTGLDVPALALIQTYGFFLAFTFLMCAWALTAELKRRERVGLLSGGIETRQVGGPLSPIDVGTNALLGFLLGFKGLYAVLNPGMFSSEGARSYLLSFEHGSWLGGILVAGLFVFSKWREHQKQQEKYPTKTTIEEEVLPHQRVGDIIILAAVSGIIGAKLLYMTERSYTSMDQVWADLFSGSGLAVYGGFILAFFVVSWYLYKKQLPWRQMLDACAPAMILGTGLGRLGCHFSGDGDWGDPNPNPKPADWIPDWIWGYRYPNNVINAGVPLEECGYPPEFGDHCMILAEPVYPTPIYEVVICLIIFAILWRLRHGVLAHGLVFAMYLTLTGLERFLLEMIRINADYTIFGLSLSQAQFISIILMLLGTALALYLLRVQMRLKSEQAATEDANDPPT